MKTRKFLWGRSGNLCAKCRRPLTADAVGVDPAVVLGEECHIVSGRPNGPRHRPLPAGALDALDNLILLCRECHELVDNQVSEFTEERLRAMRLEHERWVARLPGFPEIRVRLRDPDESEPQSLHLVETGRQLMGYMGDALSCTPENPEPRDQTEAKLLAGFLSLVDDWASIWGELGMGDRVEPEFQLSEEIRDLLSAGFVVYCGERQLVLEGGLGGPMAWRNCILAIYRVDDPLVRSPLADSATAEDGSS